MAQKDTETFLSTEELRKLTGCCHKRKQIKWLNEQRMPYWVNAAGLPVVPRTAITASSTRPTKPKESWQPSVIA